MTHFSGDMDRSMKKKTKMIKHFCLWYKYEFLHSSAQKKYMKEFRTTNHYEYSVLKHLTPAVSDCSSSTKSSIDHFWLPVKMQPVNELMSLWLEKPTIKMTI